jgi:hydroxymethylpyrimidine/phosphomethylpyrimidine kinase
MKAPANQDVNMALARGDGCTLSSLSTSNLQMEETL